jgi:3-oxoacyl-[acyl-carrier-protein] synthase II
MDRLGIFAVVAAHVALKDAGLELNDDNRNQVGVIFGTGVGPMESMENFSRPLIQEGPQAANPAVFPNTVYNAAGGQVAMNVGAIGPASTVTAGHAAGASSLCYGYDLAAAGQADAMICLAADTLTDTVIAAYRDLGLLTGNPETGGFALAEAGIALVLERASKAASRNARVYGEVLGFGIASDGRGVGSFDRDGRGVERAMRVALERSDLKAEDVKAVWSSAAGYRPADEAEEKAIRRLFGDKVTVVSPKLLMGEPMGAGGALNAALVLKAWQHPDAGIAPRGAVLVNSASLGGTHFSVALAP